MRRLVRETSNPVQYMTIPALPKSTAQSLMRAGLGQVLETFLELAETESEQGAVPSHDFVQLVSVDSWSRPPAPWLGDDLTSHAKPFGTLAAPKFVGEPQSGALPVAVTPPPDAGIVPTADIYEGYEARYKPGSIRDRLDRWAWRAGGRMEERSRRIDAWAERLDEKRRGDGNDSPPW
jgi:hypothetical protein